MDIVFNIILVFHLLGWALVLGGAIFGLREEKMSKGMLHGILTALIAGILMLGMIESGVMGWEPDHIKYGVKLVIALVVTGMVIVGGRKDKVSQGFPGGIAALTVANVVIAVLWP